MRIRNSALVVLAGTLLGATAVSGFAQNAGAASGTATPIEHLVVIFQENVSFDHYFATYPHALNGGGEPVFVPRSRAQGVNGLSGPLLTHNPNAVQPFRLSRAQAIDCDQAHDYTGEQKAVDNGLMDRFVESDGTTQTNCPDFGKGKGLVMGYYDGNTVTALWNYAEHFALSDEFFSTTFGPSTLGHLNLVSGQTNGAAIVHDSGNAKDALLNGTVINDIRPSFDDCVPPAANTISMSGINVGDLLNRKGLTWGWFQGGFAPTSRNADGAAVCASQHAQFDGSASVADYIPNHNPFQFYQSTANPHHMPPSSVAMIGRTDPANGSNSAADASSGSGACGNNPAGSPAGRCGYGQRLPLLVISRHARAGYVDHSITDQTSILRFIEDNWNLGRIGGSSFDALAGSLLGLFEFHDGGDARKLYLDPATGEPRRPVLCRGSKRRKITAITSHLLQSPGGPPVSLSTQSRLNP